MPTMFNTMTLMVNLHLRRRSNSTQLLDQASKQRVVCAQQRDVTMLITSLITSPAVTTVELNFVVGVNWP